MKKTISGIMLQAGCDRIMRPDLLGKRVDVVIDEKTESTGVAVVVYYKGERICGYIDVYTDDPEVEV